MHVVTKFLVVFCAVLSLVLAALTIAYASNAKAIGDSMRGAQDRASAAESSAKALIAEEADKRATFEKKLESAQRDLAEKDEAIATLQAERSTHRSELEQAKAEVAAIRNQINQFIATTETQATLINRYAEETGQLRDQLVTVAKREIELTDRIGDLESANEVLEQNARALKELLEETRVALQQAQSGAGSGASAAGAATPKILPGPVIRARISEVFSSPVGDMVVVSEGANRGIKEATLLNIIRGNQFIGTVEVRTVEPTQCVALVRFLNADAKVQKDDVVLSRLD